MPVILLQQSTQTQLFLIILTRSISVQRLQPMDYGFKLSSSWSCPVIFDNWRQRSDCGQFDSVFDQLCRLQTSSEFVFSTCQTSLRRYMTTKKKFIHTFFFDIQHTTHTSHVSSTALETYSSISETFDRQQQKKPPNYLSFGILTLGRHYISYNIYFIRRNFSASISIYNTGHRATLYFNIYIKQNVNISQ